MQVNKEEVFRFLDSVRESGTINMFGAAPYVQESFDVDRGEAKKLLLEWMDTFAERMKKGEVQS